MSTKTLRKRIALVAVSALGAGLLSVASVPAAHAGNLAGLNIAGNKANGGIYSVASYAAAASTGLVVDPTSADNVGINQFATMYSNGTIVVANNAASTAQKIKISGGSLQGPDKVVNAGATPVVAADLSSVSAVANASNQLVAAVKPSAAGTALVITGYDDSSSVTPSWIVNVTVIAAGSAGTLSLGNSDIALTAAGGAPVVQSVDTIGAETAENGACVYMYYNLKDAVKLQMGTTTSVIVKAPAGMTAGIATTGSYPLVATTYGGAATYAQFCQDALNVNKPVTGTATLTINGVDVASRTITIVGLAAKLTVTADAIAIRNAAYSDAAYGTAGSVTGIYYPSHSFVATDAAGNKVPTSGLTINAATLDGTVVGFGNIQQADPRNANPYLRGGGINFTCADISGANTKVTAKVTLINATTLYSDPFTVTCAGGAKNYTASVDSASSTYKTGDVMTVTVKGTDKSGKPANDYGLINSSDGGGTADGGVIASGAIAVAVNSPTKLDTFYGGVAKYKYIIGQTPGAYTVAVDFPTLNSVTYGQSAVLLPVTVVSAVAGVSNADVLKAIVSLIASINKQIAALQKALLKKK